MSIWAEKGGQVATPGVAESVVSLAVHVPFRQAEKTVQQLTAGVVSAIAVHRLVQRIGQRGIQQEEEEWRACFERGEEVKPGQQVAEVL